jgi:transcriptional regulator with XRE-family HTH domain
MTAEIPRVVPANPEFGRRLRGIRVAAGYSVEEFARGIGLPSTDYNRVERGAASLPPVFLPTIANLADAPLATVLAELYGAPETAAELHTLVTAFNAIETREQREAVLTMVLGLGGQSAD